MTLFHGFWLVAYNFLMIGTLVGAITFTVGHGVTTQWWKTQQGKNVFFYGTAITLALIFATLRTIFGDFPGRAVVSFLLVLGLFTVVWWRTVLWLIGQINRNRKKKDDS